MLWLIGSPLTIRGGGVKPDIGLSLLKGCKIVNRGTNNRIVIGDYSRLINCTITISGSNNTIYIDNRCVCNHASFWIEDDGNSIRLGEHTALCGEIQLAAIEGTEIEIGKDCLFSSKIDIRTGDSHSLIQQGTRSRLNYSASIKIGDHVWIGTGVTALKGTAIPNGMHWVSVLAWLAVTALVLIRTTLLMRQKSWAIIARLF